MRGLLAALPFVFPVFVGSVEYDPPRITPEMKAVTEAIAQALEGLTPEGFAQKSPVERYTEVNLYEKINGRSELFHAYDVTGMTFVTFSKADDPAKFIDVFLYDMATPLAALRHLFGRAARPAARRYPRPATAATARQGRSILPGRANTMRRF